MVTITAIWFLDNTYKKAYCTECHKLLKPNEKIVSVSKVMHGRQAWISNYHLGCSKEMIDESIVQTQKLLNQAIEVSEAIEKIGELAQG